MLLFLQPLSACTLQTKLLFCEEQGNGLVPRGSGFHLGESLGIFFPPGTECGCNRGLSSFCKASDDMVHKSGGNRAGIRHGGIIRDEDRHIIDEDIVCV